MSAIFIACCVVLGSMRLSAFWLATRYMLRLYFPGGFPIVVCVCGSVTIFCMYLVCRFRARYGVCFHSGSMRIVALGWLFLCVCAL